MHELRFLEVGTQKMQGFPIKEYKDIFIPRVNEDGVRVGWIRAKKIVARHPIKFVLKDDLTGEMVLGFSDNWGPLTISSLEYNKYWREQGKIKYNEKWNRGGYITIKKIAKKGGDNERT